MPKWGSTSDGQAARGEIEHESKKRGWSSSKDELRIGEAQRRTFIPHLERQYPTTQKGTKSWLEFIKKTTGLAKQWKSVSTLKHPTRHTTRTTLWHSVTLGANERTALG